MRYFYIITFAIATSIGVFKYNGGEFNPFAGEQQDGRFIIPIQIYNEYKNTDQFKKVGWDTIPIISENELHPKVTE